MVGELAIPDVVVLAVSVIAASIDVFTRRISNWLTLGGAVAAIVYAGSVDGGHGLLVGVTGWLAGLALFLPMFVLGGMGAGDVKLLACLGAWLGPRQVFWVALYASIAGGLLAVVVALSRGYLRRAFANVWLLLAHWRVSGIRPVPELTLAAGKSPRLPYALPMLVGTVAALWFR
jgi:prepilin peptidase CpaA